MLLSDDRRPPPPPLPETDHSSTDATPTPSAANQEASGRSDPLPSRSRHRAHDPLGLDGRISPPRRSQLTGQQQRWLVRLERTPVECVERVSNQWIGTTNPTNPNYEQKTNHTHIRKSPCCPLSLPFDPKLLARSHHPISTASKPEARGYCDRFHTSVLRGPSVGLEGGGCRVQCNNKQMTGPRAGGYGCLFGVCCRSINPCVRHQQGGWPIYRSLGLG